MPPSRKRARAVARAGAPSLGGFDRFLLSVAPRWALNRIRARSAALTMARHYEAAQAGPRSAGWTQSGSDANSAQHSALARLRDIARDLRRNNGWARKVVAVIANNTIGWGIIPSAVDDSKRAIEYTMDAWNTWADSPSCDFDGRLSFYGLQRLVMETVVESGDALIVRRRVADPKAPDGALSLKLHVLEPDYLDMSRNGILMQGGGPCIQGVEFDSRGRRVAYWLFDRHPGSTLNVIPYHDGLVSRRVPAEDVIHVYRMDRPGQVRGVSWLATSIQRLKDFDDYADALLMKRKIEACFAAFVSDPDGVSQPAGEAIDVNLEELGPGQINYLKPEQSITFANPSSVGGEDGFSKSQLRQIAAANEITFEDLSTDYEKVSFSSARLARLAHYQSVFNWRWHMLEPSLLRQVWEWFTEEAMLFGKIDRPAAKVVWTAPPMPMIEPDKEGHAYMTLIRSGLMSLDEAIRERGNDPRVHLESIAASNAELDRLGIKLDSDPRSTTAQGALQSAGGAEKKGAGWGKESA